MKPKVALNTLVNCSFLLTSALETNKCVMALLVPAWSKLKSWPNRKLRYPIDCQWGPDRNRCLYYSTTPNRQLPFVSKLSPTWNSLLAAHLVERPSAHIKNGQKKNLIRIIPSKWWQKKISNHKKKKEKEPAFWAASMTNRHGRQSRGNFDWNTRGKVCCLHFLFL